MTRCFRPRSPLRFRLLILGILVAAAAPAIATHAAPAQDSPSLMGICEGSHDPIALDDREGAEGELRFTIIATGDKTDEDAASVAAPEQRFRRWGVGWHGDPGIRFRSQGGWYFTLSGRIEPTGSEGSRDGINSYPRESYDYTSFDETRRNFKFAVSRQFRLWRQLSLGPVLQLSHSYWHGERENKSLDIYDDDQTYRLRESVGSERRESYGAYLGLMPMWSFGGRLSLETLFSVRYSRSFVKNESSEWTLDTNGEYSESSYSNSSTGDGFRIDSKSFSTNMYLGLYFYF